MVTSAQRSPSQSEGAHRGSSQPAVRGGGGGGSGARGEGKKVTFSILTVLLSSACERGGVRGNTGAIVCPSSGLQ